MGNIVGIDLGTTFSAMAKLNETGRPEIIDNSDGKNITPSIVEFTSATSYLVGDEAKKMIGISDDIIQEVKRSMGNSSTTYEVFGETHTPTSISALILKKLKEDAEAAYGSIDSAVVTVPANFANEAREATQRAAEMAGLKVDFIINEPTAAALAYAFQSGRDLNGTFAIYDLGGGTFDCTIAKISDQDIEILTSEGVAKLGGKDFDEAIAKLVADKYKTKTGKVLTEFTVNDAEDLKKTLSSRIKANARISGEVIEITREEFNTSISNLVIQTELAVESALERLNLKPSDITEVILVGGSTRIPVIQESIKRLFNKEPKLFGNPDESVALGAAIYAAYKSDVKDLNPLQQQAIAKLSMSEAAPYYFGTIILADNATGRLDKQNSIIIPKDEKIPCSITETYHTIADNQVNVKCTVTQSLVAETDPQFVKIIWEGQLEIQGGRPAGQPIKVTYSYTEDGKMKASFLDVGSGEHLDIPLSFNDSTPSSAPSVGSIDIDQFKVE
jgi:molecular chaperone DnaK